MSKNKLEKFAEMAALPNVLEYPFGVLREGMDFPYKGGWHSEVFKNNNPIVLELGCGRGEYTVGLGRLYPDKNFIGIDIKGNRMWTGATTAYREGLDNVRFLRTHIEMLTEFFAQGEVAEIWITFPDPQMKKVRKRLTSVRFLQRYKSILAPDDGVLHLKSDSPFLYTFTKALAEYNGLTILKDIQDIHSKVSEDSVLRMIRTYYESQWVNRGLTINYLALKLDNLSERSSDPDIEIEHDPYRSYGRQRRSEINLL